MLIVAPAVDLADQERTQLENQQEISELAPLTTELIKVKVGGDAGRNQRSTDGISS